MGGLPEGGQPHGETGEQGLLSIDTDPAKWTDTAKDKLPGVTGDHLEVFRQLQPWFWDEEARAHGVAVFEPSADAHPLSRLHHLANVDRHRVPHPVLARAGDTWLGTPEGVSVKAVPVNYWGARPGDVLLEWRVDPRRGCWKQARRARRSWR